MFDPPDLSLNTGVKNKVAPSLTLGNSVTFGPLTMTNLQLS